MRQARQAQSQFAAGLRRAVLAVWQLLADHQARHRLRRLLGRDALATELAAAQHGGGVAQGLDFVELVADVEDGATLGRELAQGLEQLLDRLRGEHRGGFVHDQQARVLQQAADDLHTLAFAHRQRMHVAARVDGQAVALGYLGDALRQCAQRRPAGQGQRHVLDHAQGLEQREVLEHHAYAQAAGVGRVGDLYFVTFPQHLSGARVRDAVDDLHERGFAGAVLAQDGADLARAHRQVNAVVGDHGRIDLADALELQARRRARVWASVMRGGRGGGGGGGAALAHGRCIHDSVGMIGLCVWARIVHQVRAWALNRTRALPLLWQATQARWRGIRPGPP